VSELKVPVSLRDVSGITIDVMRRTGLLLVSVNRDGKPNVMTIGWGFIGILWREPYFIIAVRPSRYTYTLLERSLDFTVNVPSKGMERVVEYCGTFSGRDVDKFKKCGLTPLKAKVIKSPIIKECVIHYECVIKYRCDLMAKLMPEDVLSSWYPSNDYHRIYFGNIVEVYADEDYETKVR